MISRKDAEKLNFLKLKGLKFDCLTNDTKILKSKNKEKS